MTRTKVSLSFILVSCAAVIGYVSLSGNVQSFFHNAIGALAVICVLAGVRLHRPTTPLVWYVLAAGLSLLVVGDLTANIATLSSAEYPFPSILDAYYLLGNLSVVIAGILIIRARSRFRDMGAFIDATILATSATFLAWKFFMQPYADDPSLTALQKAVSLAYPAMMMLMFAVVVRLVFTRGRRSLSFYFMVAAIGSSLVGDAIYTELVLLGAYYPGHPIDIAYVLWFIFWAAAALHPSMTSATSGSDAPSFRTSNRRMVFLVAAVLLVPATTIVLWWRGDPVTVPVFVGFSTLLFLLVFWRMRDSVRQSESAYAERQLALNRERVLHEVSSGLAVSSTQAEAFEAVTSSLRSITGDSLTAQIALVERDTGVVTNACDTCAPDLRGMTRLVTAKHHADRSHTGVEGRSDQIVRALNTELASHDPGTHHNIHVLNPEGDTLVTLIVSGSNPLTRMTDLLKGVGAQLMQALERISLAEDIARRKNQEVFHSLVRNSSDVTMIIEVDGCIRYVSPAARTALGFVPEALVGTQLREFIHPDDIPATEAFMADVINHRGNTRTTEFRMKNVRHAWQDMEAVANNLIDDPDVNGVVLNVHDISVRKRSEAMLEYQAFHDALTSLPNRALLLDRLSQAMEQANRHGERVAVLFIDLDRFKFINDSLGHDSGDALLIMASQRIQQCVADNDTVARLGGDEFTVILNDAENTESPTDVAARLVRELGEPFCIKDRETTVTVSIGVALSGPHHTNSEDLLRDADIAMYHAKSQGRNGFVLFDAEMGHSIEKRVQLEQDLRRALGRNEFVLHYQPEIELASGRIKWFEALIRWQHPQQGLLYPSEFVPLAEESGLILEIGKWVIHEACRQAQDWSDRFPAYPFGVSVNLSTRQLLDPRLVDEIHFALQSTGLQADLLRMEITETTLMGEMEVSLNTLNALRMLGVQLAIDDFGNGYSSLGYLRYFPIDVLKLDRSFLGETMQPEQDDAIIHAVTTLAHSLNIQVTVEGIETPEHLMRVKSLACDQGQGYFFARPEEVTDVPGLLEQESLIHDLRPSRV